MNVTLTIGILGIVLIAAIGFWGRRQPVKDMGEWAVAGRRFGVMTTWILQAGETFTTFTFLGTVGLVVSLGASAFYCIPYIPLAYIVMYWIAPKLWRQAKASGYVTQSDFLRGNYDSPALGLLSAVFGIVFLLPYLQLQITGARPDRQGRHRRGFRRKAQQHSRVRSRHRLRIVVRPARCRPHVLLQGTC